MVFVVCGHIYYRCKDKDQSPAETYWFVCRVHLWLSVSGLDFPESTAIFPSSHQYTMFFFFFLFFPGAEGHGIHWMLWNVSAWCWSRKNNPLGSRSNKKKYIGALFMWGPTNPATGSETFLVQTHVCETLSPHSCIYVAPSLWIPPERDASSTLEAFYKSWKDKFRLTKAQVSRSC